MEGVYAYVYPYIIQCPPLCVNPCNANMVCEDPNQTRVHEAMGRPVRSFPCRSICYPPLPLAQHPQHAAEVLSALRQRTLFGSSASSSTTTKAQQSSDQRQQIWNANSLPSTQNTAKPASDMIATPRHFTILGPLGFPHLVTPTSASKQWVCQGIDRRKKLSLLVRSRGGVVTACPPFIKFSSCTVHL